jgi:exodeoxyribonuclease-3
MLLKVATWNVNSLRVRLPHVKAWLHETGTNLLFLQELKAEDHLFPPDFAQNGWHCAVFGQKAYNGVAILARFPLTEVSLGFPPALEAQHQLPPAARLIAATIQAPQGPLRVITVYIPNGESLISAKFAYKEQFYQALTAYTQQQLALYPRLILGGDFNIAADARDVADPVQAARQLLFSPQEQAWLQAFQANTGLHDALRLVNQAPGIYSWFDHRIYKRDPTNGKRIDYLFVSPPLTASVQQVTHFVALRGQPQPSDHIPILAQLQL